MNQTSPFRTLLIYGLLLGGTAIFTLPFLWMAGRSVMVDRELFASDLSFLPAAPVPARTSPYLDTRAVPKPADETAFEKARAPILAAFDASGWAAPGWLTQTNGLREAAAAGLGIALLPDFSAREALADGRLVEVLGGWRSTGAFGEHLYALRPYGPHVPRAVHALVNHLRLAMQDKKNPPLRVG